MCIKKCRCFIFVLLDQWWLPSSNVSAFHNSWLPTPKDKSHFFSSSESEEEEDHRKKFKIKIKPLLADDADFVAPSVDELKASIGNIALSPSPLVSPAYIT